MRIPIIYGTRLFGKVDRIPGVLHVASRFNHVFFVPIVPAGSFIIMERERQDGGLQGIKIDLNLKSVIAAYARTALVIGGALSLLIGVITFFSALAPSSSASLLGAVGAIFVGGVCLGGYWLSHKLMRPSPERAQELADMIGIRLRITSSTPDTPDTAEETPASPAADDEAAWQAEAFEHESEDAWQEEIPESDGQGAWYQDGFGDSGPQESEAYTGYYPEQDSTPGAGEFIFEDRQDALADDRAEELEVYADSQTARRASKRYFGLTVPQLGVVAILAVITCLVFAVGGWWVMNNLPAIEPRPPSPTSPPAATGTPLPTATEIPPPDLEEGWTLRQHPEDGLAIGLPAEWVEMDIHADSLDAALAPIMACCPLDLTTPFWSGQTLDDLHDRGLKFFAIDPETPRSGARYGNVNIIHKSYDEPWTLDEAVESLEKEYEDEGTEVTHYRVTLPVGEAEVFKSTEGIEYPRLTLKYLLVQGEDIWFITMACDATFADRYTATFTQIAESFRWIDEPVDAATPEPVSPSCLPDAVFIADVTIPDGTELDPGASFAKTWRIRSNGCAPWPAGTRLVFASGDAMDGAGAEVAETAVGDSADVTVQLVAPSEPGSYKGNWQMEAPDGTRFGDLFYVLITVR